MLRVLLFPFLSPGVSSVLPLFVELRVLSFLLGQGQASVAEQALVSSPLPQPVLEELQPSVLQPSQALPSWTPAVRSSQRPVARLP